MTEKKSVARYVRFSPPINCIRVPGTVSTSIDEVQVAVPRTEENIWVLYGRVHDGYTIPHMTPLPTTDPMIPSSDAIVEAHAAIHQDRYVFDVSILGHRVQWLKRR